MCLIAWRWAPNTIMPLLWAANRDEFFHRQTAPLHAWDAQGTTVYGGLDLAIEPQAGLFGTWAGITETGRFAWLTNIRSPNDKNPEAPSRGHLVSQYLAGTQRPSSYITQLRSKASKYNGFNLILGDLGCTRAPKKEQECWHYNSRSGVATHLKPGIYGVSNATLDSPWPKTRALVHAVAMYSAQRSDDPMVNPTLNTAALFDALSVRTLYKLEELPETGVPHEIEQLLSAAFISTDIRGAGYGTRSSTVGYVLQDQVTLEERTFDEGAQGHQQTAISFLL